MTTDLLPEQYVAELIGQQTALLDLAAEQTEQCELSIHTTAIAWLAEMHAYHLELAGQIRDTGGTGSIHLRHLEITLDRLIQLRAIHLEALDCLLHEDIP